MTILLMEIVIDAEKSPLTIGLSHDQAKVSRQRYERSASEES